MKDKIIFKRPTLSDYENVRSIWEDPETMEAVGGIHKISKEYYVEWLERMLSKGKNCYFLIYYYDKCVGEVSFHRFNKITKTADLNIKVITDHRNKGIGRKALDFILKIFFHDWNGNEIIDKIGKENRVGLNALKAYGFRERKSDDEDTILFLTKRDFNLIAGNSSTSNSEL